MNVSTSRLAPLRDEELTELQERLVRPILERTAHQNVYRTLVRHPELYRSWTVFARYLLQESSLTPRLRELVILRCAWLCRSEYEWAQHLPLAKHAGITAAEIECVKDGPRATGWTDRENTLLFATDELHETYHLSDALWAQLTGWFSTEELLDLLFVVGQYHLVAMVLNTLGVEVDPGLSGFHR